MPMRNRLRRLRERDGLTRRQLATRLQPSLTTGEPVDPSTIRRWEKSDTGIPDERKVELADVFDVSVADLMGWDGQPAVSAPYDEAA